MDLTINTELAKTKLKRLKVPFHLDQNTLILGRSEQNGGIYGLLGVIVIVVTLVLATAIVLLSLHYLESPGIGFVAPVVLAGLFILKVIDTKKRNYKGIKQFERGQILIDNEEGLQTFAREDVDQFLIEVTTEKDQYKEGRLNLILEGGKSLTLMSLHHENEQFIIDDLNWFSGLMNVYTGFHLETFLIKQYKESYL